jgi:hypothetical protein
VDDETLAVHVVETYQDLLRDRLQNRLETPEEGRDTGTGTIAADGRRT